MIFSEKCRQHLGCWKDYSTRAISGKKSVYDNNPIEECYDKAARNKYTVFAVQVGKECFTAANAGQTYKKYGRSNKCEDGTGGSWQQDVYLIVPCLGILHIYFY